MIETYGVLCTQADGERVIVKVAAETAQAARDQVFAHKRLFYGGGDAAGRWLASQNPGTLVDVGEVRPLADWPE